MSGAVAHIWRHPIKSHGHEAVASTALMQGRTMPWDRIWAVAHEQSKADGTSWAHCANFSRGAKAPNLMAISAQLDEATGIVTLRHPDRPDLSFDPDGPSGDFIEWVAPLMPADRPASVRLVRVAGRGMTDSNFPSISLCNLASNRAVGEQIGNAISPLRWRGNIWFDLPEPWLENNWIGKTIRLGSAELFVREPITRCMATAANPDTGIRDEDTLGALRAGWGHQEFGVYCEVTKSGDVALGDQPQVLS